MEYLAKYFDFFVEFGYISAYLPGIFCTSFFSKLEDSPLSHGIMTVEDIVVPPVRGRNLL
jgi:hypothetical protein